MNKILISIKHVYGNETIYPECELAKQFCEIAGTTTMTQKTLSIVKKMGYKIERKQLECSFV